MRARCACCGQVVPTPPPYGFESETIPVPPALAALIHDSFDRPDEWRYARILRAAVYNWAYCQNPDLRTDAAYDAWGRAFMAAVMRDPTSDETAALLLQELRPKRCAWCRRPFLGLKVAKFCCDACSEYASGETRVGSYGKLGGPDKLERRHRNNAANKARRERRRGVAAGALGASA